MLAALTNNADVAWALAIVALILFGIAVAQSRLVSIVAWAGVAVSLGLILFWWP